MSMVMMLERLSVEPQGQSEEETPLPAVDSSQGVEAGMLQLFNPDATADEALEASRDLLEATLSVINDVRGSGRSDDSDDEPEGSLCLEKSWHGLHYLLTGDSWGGAGPSAFLLVGGTEQGEDLGYGPARHFTAGEAQDIAKELGGIEADDLWLKFDAQTMTTKGISPEIWDEPVDELQEEYLDYYEELRAFVADTAERGEGFKIYLT